MTRVCVSCDSRARAFVRTPISFSFIITLFSVCFYFRPLNKNSKVRCLKLFFRLLFSVKARLLVCVLVHCRGGRVSTEGPEGRGRAWGRPLGSALLGQTPPGAHAARSARCPGAGALPSLLGSSLWDLRALSLVFCHKSSWPGPPWGSPRPPRVPLCPVVPTLPTGRQRGAVCISRQRESAARPARGGRRHSLRVPRGRSVPPASSWSRWPGQRGVTGGSHVVNGRPVLARGA